jgi:imidazolonepropionase-like amidohydrolase
MRRNCFYGVEPEAALGVGALAAVFLCAAVLMEFTPRLALAQSAQVLAFVGERVIPGDGSAPIENATFVVRAGQITQVGSKSSVKVPKDAVQVDLAGKTVIPMLEELHVHIGYMKNGATNPNVKDGMGVLGGHVSKDYYTRENILDELRRFRYYGVGAVQSLGTDRNDLELEIRNEQQSGRLKDDTLALLFTAGDGIVAYNNGNENGGPSFARDVVHEARTPEDARAFVRQEAAKKVDVIKFWLDDRYHTKPLMAPAIYQAIIDEAHKQHLRVIAHVVDLAAAKAAARAGVDGLAHPPHDTVVDDEFLQLMKQNDVFQCSTMSSAMPDRAWLDEPELAETVPVAYRDYMKAMRTGGGNTQSGDPNAPSRTYSVMLINEKKESDAGIRIVISGDTAGGEGRFPGYTEHRELQALAEAGIPPLQVIRDGTQVSADALGLRDMDSLAAGKRADFIVLNANPLDDLKNTRKISAVYVEGRAIDRGAMRDSIGKSGH